MEKKTTQTKKKVTPTAGGLKATVYNQSGAETSTIALPEKVFGVKWNDDLVHQVVVSMMANKRAGTAHTKNRGEVSGGGKKPWKQKGTGRARHGSSRSPIWTGGGTTFGPRSEKDYSKKINKKMRAKALYTILSRKFAQSELLFVDALSLSEMKTKSAQAVLSTFTKVPGFERLTSKKATTALIAVPELTAEVQKSFANLPGVTLMTTSDLNALSTSTYKHLIIVDPEKTLGILEAKMSK